MQDPAEMIPDDVPKPDPEEQARIDQAWKAVALRRAREFKEGRVKAVPWEEAEARVREMLAGRREQK